jgi:hypothetical protein
MTTVLLPATIYEELSRRHRTPCQSRNCRILLNLCLYGAEQLLRQTAVILSINYIANNYFWPSFVFKVIFTSVYEGGWPFIWPTTVVRTPYSVLVRIITQVSLPSSDLGDHLRTVAQPENGQAEAATWRCATAEQPQVSHIALKRQRKHSGRQSQTCAAGFTQ